MNTYLTIMVTILVLTQIVRIIQNTIQLRRQYKLFQAQLGQLDDITQEDLDMQRRAYRLIVDHFERSVAALCIVKQTGGAKITPPCYVPDGDGCAYQIYGDNNDEPIDRCKSCPLCQSDKIRHKQESVHNDPLVLDELRQMRGEPVWCKELECYGIVKMEKVGSWANELFLVGTWHNGDAAVNFEYDIKSRGLTLYRHKPEEGTV